MELAGDRFEEDVDPQPDARSTSLRILLPSAARTAKVLTTVARVLFAACLVTVTLVTQAAASPITPTANLEASLNEQEVALLRRIRDVRDASGFVRKIFILKPLVDLLTAQDPGDLIIAISGTDLEAISGAFNGMHTIEACTIRDEIQLWRVVNDDRHSSDAARQFFDLLVEGADARCG